MFTTEAQMLFLEVCKKTVTDLYSLNSNTRMILKCKLIISKYFVAI